MDPQTTPITNPPKRVLYRTHTWRDVFVLVDTGRMARAEYSAVTNAILLHAASHPAGLGFLVVVPRNATPPPEETRKGINETYDAIASHVRSVCWVVEGTGFQASMARAVLTGLRMFQRRPYATHVATDLQPAMAWTLSHLDEGSNRLAQVPEAVRTIAASRQALGDP